MKIKINNNTYEILFVDCEDANLQMDDDEYHSGVTDFREKKIYIANNLNADSYRYTITHELTHAFIDSYGLLQIDWNDEIVADFVGNYLPNIVDILENNIEKENN